MAVGRVQFMVHGRSNDGLCATRKGDREISSRALLDIAIVVLIDVDHTNVVTSGYRVRLAVR